MTAPLAGAGRKFAVVDRREPMGHNESMKDNAKLMPITAQVRELLI